MSPSTGLHRNANSTCLNGRALKTDLEAALGRSVSMANDANCLALSEAVDGAGADGRIVFAVILGTGCGGGLAIDKHVIEGRNGVGGEWGHIPLPRRGGEGWPSRPCYCSLNDCLEQYLSGPAIEQEHLERSGQSMRVTDIAQSAARGDDAAIETLSLFHDRLADALAVVVNILDPDVFVLGGGVSNLPGLAETIQPMLAERVFGGECVTPVRPAKHGDSSGVRGARVVVTELDFQGDDASSTSSIPARVGRLWCRLVPFVTIAGWLVMMRRRCPSSTGMRISPSGGSRSRSVSMEAS